MSKLKPLPTPIVMYKITDNCQLRCKHCYNESGGINQYTVPTHEIMRNIERLAPHTGTLNFIGGEPLLVKELPELIAHAHSCGIDTVQASSNGLRLLAADGAELTQRLENAGLHMIKIGLSGVSTATNDVIRGPGVFARATKVYDLLAPTRIATCLKVCIDKANRHEMEECVKFALRHSIDQILYGQLINHGRARNGLVDRALEAEELEEMHYQFLELREKYAAKRGQLRIARYCAFSGRCAEPGLYYTITSRGSITPCFMREDLATGSIATDSIPELFAKSDAARQAQPMHHSVKDLGLIQPTAYAKAQREVLLEAED